MNSTRSITHATYVPMDVAPEEDDIRATALRSINVIAEIAPSADEIAMLRDSFASDPAMAEAATAIALATAPERGFLDRLSTLDATDPALIFAGLDRVLQDRRERAEQVGSVILELSEQMSAPSPSVTPAPAASVVVDTAAPVATVLTAPTFPSVTDLGPLTVTTADVHVADRLDIAPLPGLATLAIATGDGDPAGLSEPSVAGLLNANADAGLDTAPVVRLLTDLHIDPVTTPASTLHTTLLTQIDRQALRLTEYLQALTVSPIGHLHLERVEFNPVGTERGELVYTAPLAPEETFNFTHTEWSLVQEELESYVRDELDDFSERGVTEKTDLSQSFENEAKVDQQFKASAKVGGSYGKVFTFSAATSYDRKDATREAIKQSIKAVKDVTHKASTRAKQEHKQTFKVSTQTRVEDTVTRQIKNPHNDRSMRVDYYRMMRRWRVDLLRYGMRLTWDLNVPEPGLDLLARLQAIRLLDRMIAVPFESYFTFTFEDTEAAFTGRDRDLDDPKGFGKIRRAASKYGADISPPPTHLPSIQETQIKTFTGEQQVKEEGFVEFKWEFPEYYLPGGRVDLAWLQLKGTPQSAFAEIEDVNYAVGSSELQVIVHKQNATSLALRLRFAALELREDAKMTWRLETFAAIRDAAQEQYDRLKGLLIEHRETLQAQFQDQDTLTLRRLEREEVIKNVLRWLLGPSFRFVLPGMEAPAMSSTLGGRSARFYDALTRSVINGAVHELVLKHGELIKFLHQAVEWENVQYVLYPYFWVNPGEWQLKLDLRHRDPVHEAFLKAGSARVVLPVRPGFEARFAMFMERGKLEVPTEGPVPPYVRIAQEMQNAARTNYPGIRAANPEGNARPLLTYRQRRAWAEMEDIIALLERYRRETGQYPSALADLDGLSPAPSPALATRRDPWGTPYHYKFPGDFAEFDLASYGANGVAGPGDGSNPENADITSWADAALIGTWFEYTPTSAMDIDVQQTKLAE